MGPREIIRAWKDPYYRETVRRRARVDHPLGEIHDDYLAATRGGAAKSMFDNPASIPTGSDQGAQCCCTPNTYCCP